MGAARFQVFKCYDDWDDDKETVVPTQICIGSGETMTEECGIVADQEDEPGVDLRIWDEENGYWEDVSSWCGRP